MHDETLTETAPKSSLSKVDELRAELLATKVVHDLPPFIWYDSQFLAKFEGAKRFLGLVRPDAVDGFEKAFDVLRTQSDFTIPEIGGLLPQVRFEQLRAELQTVSADRLKTYENETFGRVIFHDHPSLTSLQHELTDVVSELAGEPVEPCYNFLSFYHGAGMCPPHMDAPSAKWTLDLCLDQNCEWPIWFSRIIPWPTMESAAGWDGQAVTRDPSLEFRSHVLRPNNAVLFSGSSQWHYRDAIPDGGYCHLAFLHYRPAGTEVLTEAKHWAKHFNLPELAIFDSVFDAMRPVAN